MKVNQEQEIEYLKTVNRVLDNINPYSLDGHSHYLLKIAQIMLAENTTDLRKGESHRTSRWYNVEDFMSKEDKKEAEQKNG